MFLLEEYGLRELVIYANRIFKDFCSEQALPDVNLEGRCLLINYWYGVPGATKSFQTRFL